MKLATGWRAQIPKERAVWLELYRNWPDREPFAHPGFVERFLGQGDEAVLFSYVDGRGGAFMPLIVRRLPAWANGFEALDATSPYGYGGAFLYGEVDANSFWKEVAVWAADWRVVSLFCRLSLFPEEVVPFPGRREEVLQNVVRSLNVEDDALWMDYDHKVRKNIKKALRSDLTVEVDQEGGRMEEFHQIYLSTMDRRDASDTYYFPLEFFRELGSQCPDETVYFHTVLGGRVISTELVLVGAQRTYSFLGGTDRDFFDLRPNDLLKHEIIRWSREQGKKQFVLGGGYQPDDGIFRYKLSFAPKDGVRPFSVGKLVFDQILYDRLVERRRHEQPGWNPKSGFFPEYRAPQPASESEPRS